MKNTFIIFAFLFLGGNLFAQATDDMPTVEETVLSFTNIYNLDQDQQIKMLEIQERKYKNFGEIEDLKNTNPKKYQQKVDAMRTADLGHMHQLLNDDQLRIYREKQVELRKEKAELFKDMRGSGTSQKDIEIKMVEMDVNALLYG